MNEFLDIATGKRVTECVAEVLAAEAAREHAAEAAREHAAEAAR